MTAVNFRVGDRLQVIRDFTAYGFEVVKVYCSYPIQIKVGDLVEVTGRTRIWGMGFRVLVSDQRAFACARIAEKDRWLADLTMSKNANGWLFAALADPGYFHNEEALRPEDVFSSARLDSQSVRGEPG